MGSLIERGSDVEAWGEKVEDWGETVSVETMVKAKKAKKRLPAVLHFAPRVFVRVSDEHLAKWERLVREEFGLAVSVSDDDDGPYGPQATVSGSGDGWDDCD
jgi:hypothetical protein